MRFAALLFAALASGAALAGVAGPLPRATPESQGVRSEAVLKLIDLLSAEGDKVHSYMLLRHGKVVAEGWWAPYDANTPHALFSVSKAFVGMGIGYAVEDGLMTLNDRVNWFFPASVPPGQDTRAGEIRVRDLLAMASGQKTDSMDLLLSAAPGEQAKAFFSIPMEEPPGLRFRYMSGNSAMLALIHRKVTGERDLVKYLKPRLFDRLGIGERHWVRQSDGTVLGGWGFELTTEELAKVGQLLLQGGRWNGESVLPSWWVSQSTSRQTAFGNVLDPVLVRHTGGANAKGDSAPDDWEVGYGYQLWMGNHGTFRLCGACGQIAVVMPSEDVVFVSTAGGSGSNKLSVEAFYAAILPGLAPAAFPENPQALRRLRERSAGLALGTPGKGVAPARQAVEIAARGCELETRPLGIESVRYDDKTGMFEFRNGFGVQRFAVGRDGRWAVGSAEVEDGRAGDLDKIAGGPQPLGASGAWTKEHEFRFRVVFTRTQVYADVTLDCSREPMRIASDCPVSGRYRIGGAEK